MARKGSFSLLVSTTHWTVISGFSRCFTSSFITAGFLVALLSDCVDLLFSDVLLQVLSQWQTCQFPSVVKSSFSRIILCFDLRNIVGTLCSTASCTSIGNFLWKMPSLASRSLQLEAIAFMRSDYLRSKTRDQFLRNTAAFGCVPWLALIPVRSSQCTWFMAYRTRNVTFEARLFWYMAFWTRNITCDARLLVYGLQNEK